MTKPDQVRAELREAASGLPSIYDDPAHYDLLAQMTAPADVPLYRALVAARPGSVLELGCGTGRVALALAGGPDADGREIAGLEVVGVELVEAMVEAAARKAAAAGLEVTFALGDLRTLDLGRAFDWLLMPYNVLNHMLTPADLTAALAAARAHMDGGSRLVVDTFQPSLAFLGADHSAPRPILRYRDPYLDKEVVLSEENHYDSAAQINRVVWRYAVDDVADARVDEMRMRILFPQELDAHVRHAGLAIEAKWGDYDRRPFDAQSPKQILLCRRAE